jgi:chromosome segregation ATPase
MSQRNVLAINLTADVTNLTAVENTVENASTTMGDTMLMAEEFRERVAVTKQGYQNAVDHYNMQVEQVKGQQAALVEQIRAAEEELTRLKGERDALAQANAEIERRYNDRQLQNARVRAEVDAVEQRMDTVQGDIARTETAITSKEQQYQDLHAALATSADNLRQLEVGLEETEQKLAAVEAKHRSIKMTWGQTMTAVNMILRLSGQVSKNMDENVSRFFSYAASMASHTASLAWQAAALANATGNPILAGLHIAIAVQSTVQQSMLIAERESMRAAQARDAEIYGGDRAW